MSNYALIITQNPCAVPKHRRDTSAGGAKVADIYARPALVGARSGSVRALPVATPTVPDFAGPLSPQAATPASSDCERREFFYAVYYG